MNEAGNLLLAQTAWLYTKLYEGPLFFLDLWSLVHLSSGFLLMLALRAGRSRRPFLALTAVLLAYELLELAFIFVAFHAFRPETLKDQLTDIVVGWAGAALAMAVVRVGQELPRSGRERLARHAAASVASVAVAFHWVGNYGYTYNQPALNSPGICWWAWLLWTLTLLAIAQAYASLEERLGSARDALALVALGYGVMLLGLEHVGYVVLGIREIGHAQRTALVLDLVHGTPAMHAFYGMAPVLGVVAFAATRALFRSATGTAPSLRERAPGDVLAPAFARASEE